MKQVIMKRLLIAGIALLTVPASVLAQNQKEKEDKDNKEKNDLQTIVITRKNISDDKLVIEVEGNKVKVNGKDLKDNKDISVHVNTMKGRGAYVYNSDGNFNNFSLFNEDENRAMLGVNTQDDDKGAEIESVTDESAADKAGLKKGDVITMIGDKKIEDADDVTQAIRGKKPGDKVSITYLRDGKEQKTTTELTKWKGIRMNAMSLPRIENLNGNWSMPQSVVVFGRPRMGLSIQDTEDGVGVKVLDVDDESAAAKAGIKKDDVIVGVDDVDVKSTDDVVRATRPKADKFTYNFKVKRGGATQNIEVKLPRKLKTADL